MCNQPLYLKAWQDDLASSRLCHCISAAVLQGRDATHLQTLSSLHLVPGQLTEVAIPAPLHEPNMIPAVEGNTSSRCRQGLQSSANATSRHIDQCRQLLSVCKISAPLTR
jgi:hypothetical protein